MGTPPLRQDLILETVARVEEELRAGYRPKGMPGSGEAAIMAAAKKAVADGFMATTAAFESRVGRCIHQGFEPDWSLYRPYRLQQPQPRSVLIPASQPPIPHSGNRGQRVLAIGDLHQDPRHPHRTEILTRIARYASRERFDHIVQIGDWGTFDSVSTHDKADSYSARLKPTIKQDMECIAESLRAWRLGMDADYKPKQWITTGNHEHRLARHEDANPASQGMFTGQLAELFLQFGWRTKPYGEIHYIEGVGFTHHPTNGAGRAYGGKTGPSRAANDTCITLVGGHTHKKQMFDTGKIGPTETVSVIEIGCAMEWGEVESYVGVSPAGWWWGVIPMTVRDGAITDIEFTSMLTLREQFGA
jgi:predicted phosphodiesterase